MVIRLQPFINVFVYLPRKICLIKNWNDMGKFELMALPYAMDALEPVISRQTLEVHHGKHLAGYVNNLNAMLPGSGFEEASLE